MTTLTDRDFFDTSKIPARVRAGVELLWDRQNVSLHSIRGRILDYGGFDISDYCGCTLGCLFGHYDEGKQTLELDEDQAILFGFSGPITVSVTPDGDQISDPEAERYWDALQAEWLRTLDIEVDDAHRVLS